MENIREQLDGMLDKGNEDFESRVLDCADAEIYKAFEDCALRALAGEKVMIEYELAKVAGTADWVMNYLERPSIITGEFEHCFDAERLTFEGLVENLVVTWKNKIVPAIKALNMIRRYQEPAWTLYGCNRYVTRGELDQALDNLKGTENNDANTSQEDLRTIYENLVKMNEDLLKALGQTSDLDRKLDNAKAQMDALKKTLQCYKKA